MPDTPDVTNLINPTETLAASALAPDCARTQEELAAYLDGELLPAQTALAEAHLAVCPHCAAHRDELRATLALANAFAVDREVDVANAALEYIAQETPEPLLATPRFVAPPALVTAVDRERARAQSEGVPFIDLVRNPPEPPALATLPADLARRYRAVPVRRDGSTLFVAMANPRDAEAVDAIRTTSRCMVRPMLAETDQLDAAITRAYPAPDQHDTAITPIPSTPLTEMGQLLAGMQAMQAELSALRGEVADLRRQMATVRGRADSLPPKPAAPRLFPFAAPANLSERG